MLDPGSRTVTCVVNYGFEAASKKCVIEENRTLKHLHSVRGKFGLAVKSM